MIGGINMVVAFTGYRPEKMPFVESKKDEAYLKFRKRQLQVIERLIERGCTHFISGVAMGFDTWVAEDILALQKNNSSLELECAIPFPGQADRWSTSDQKRRYKILTHATSSVIVCEHYSSNCFFERNKYMVNKADSPMSLHQIALSIRRFPDFSYAVLFHWKYRTSYNRPAFQNQCAHTYSHEVRNNTPVIRASLLYKRRSFFCQRHR